MRRSVAVCAVALSALALGACGSSKTSTSGTATSTTAGSSSAGTSSSATYPAGKEQVCQARDQLKTSVAALVDPALLKGGATGIKAAVDQVQTDLDDLKAAVQQDYKAQVDALQAALQELQTAVGNLGSGSVSQNLQTVGTDIAAVGRTAGDLLTQLATSCGS